jgi:two-component system nitrogen regulation response regulator GlnG
MTPSVLVIDGDPETLADFRHYFQAPDFTLQTAASGAEGLKLAAKNLPDVAIVALRLPDLSGLQVFHRLRQLDPRLPVIFVTNQGTAETAI